MKQWILSFLLLFGTSLALAGSRDPSGTFKADDFNQMIQENQKEEAQLRTRLQEKAGIRLDESKPGTVAREKLDISSEPEQVIVSSSQPIWKEKKDKNSKSQFKAEMKRISQELDEASH